MVESADSIPENAQFVSRIRYHRLIKPATELEAFPLARSGHRLLADESDLYLIGGYVQFPNSIMSVVGEIWRFNLLTQKWFKMEFTNPAFKLGASHAAIKVEDLIIVHGGTGSDFGAEVDNTLICMNVRTLVCFVLPQKNKDNLASNEPIPTYGHSLCSAQLDKNDQYLYKYGGALGNVYTSNIYRYSIRNMHWESVQPLSGKIAPRYRHDAFVWDGKMYIIGGSTSSVEFAFLPVPTFDLKRLSWDYVQFSGTVPQPVRFQSAAQDENYIYIVGGVSFAGQKRNRSVYRFDLEARNSVKVAKHNSPAYFHDVAFVPKLRKLYSFGGVVRIEPVKRTNHLHEFALNDRPLSLQEMAWHALKGVLLLDVSQSLDELHKIICSSSPGALQSMALVKSFIKSPHFTKPEHTPDRQQQQQQKETDEEKSEAKSNLVKASSFQICPLQMIWACRANAELTNLRLRRREEEETSRKQNQLSTSDVATNTQASSAPTGQNTQEQETANQQAVERLRTRILYDFLSRQMLEMDEENPRGEEDDDEEIDEFDENAREEVRNEDEEEDSEEGEEEEAAPSSVNSSQDLSIANSTSQLFPGNRIWVLNRNDTVFVQTDRNSSDDEAEREDRPETVGEEDEDEEEEEEDSDNDYVSVNSTDTVELDQSMDTQAGPVDEAMAVATSVTPRQAVTTRLSDSRSGAGTISGSRATVRRGDPGSSRNARVIFGGSVRRPGTSVMHYRPRGRIFPVSRLFPRIDNDYLRGGAGQQQQQQPSRQFEIYHDPSVTPATTVMDGAASHESSSDFEYDREDSSYVTERRNLNRGVSNSDFGRRMQRLVDTIFNSRRRPNTEYVADAAGSATSSAASRTAAMDMAYMMHYKMDFSAVPINMLDYLILLLFVLGVPIVYIDRLPNSRKILTDLKQILQSDCDQAKDLLSLFAMRRKDLGLPLCDTVDSRNVDWPFSSDSTPFCKKYD